MLKREVQRAEEESKRNQSIISDYKQICKQLNQRLEEQQGRSTQLWQHLQDSFSSCSTCSPLLTTLAAEFESQKSNTGTFSGNSSPTSLEARSNSLSIESRFEQQVKIHLFY